MIREELDIKEEYFELTNKLILQLKEKSILDLDKSVVALCGESGSGKSITAKCLQSGLSKLNIRSTILHQDNYYKLPPNENHAKRKNNINWVGINEVKLKQLQTHIDDFKSGKQKITTPVVDYLENDFSEIEITLSDKPIMIVEGVYTFMLENIDYKIFLDRTYLDTKELRKNRTRENYDPFVEEILAIEHKTIKALKSKSDLVISKDYDLIKDKGVN